MNTLHFKYALEVEKTGSITQAADNLFMGQPSLSKAIKELEDTLNIEIFKRSSKGMVPTEEGARFLQYAKNILIQLENMEQISAEKNDDRSKIRVAYPHSSYLFRAMLRFSRELIASPSFRFEALELSTVDTFKQVLEGKLSFAIVRIPRSHVSSYRELCKPKSLKMESIWQFSEMVITSENTEELIRASLSTDNPLSAAFTTGNPLPSVLSTDDLASFTEVRFATPPAQPLFPDVLDSTDSHSAKNKARKQIVVHSQAEALSYISDCPGSYLVFEPLSGELMEEYQLSAIELSEATTYEDFLLYPKEHVFQKTERALIDKIFEQKNHIAF